MDYVCVCTSTSVGGCVGGCVRACLRVCVFKILCLWVCRMCMCVHVCAYMLLFIRKHVSTLNVYGHVCVDALCHCRG